MSSGVRGRRRSTNTNNKRSKNHFRAEWEEDYCFVMSEEEEGKCTCLLCNHCCSAKRGTLERHFRSRHKSFNKSFPAKTEMRKTKVEELKSQLAADFENPVGTETDSEDDEANASTSEGNAASSLASDAHHVSLVLARYKMDGENLQFFKDCFSAMASCMLEEEQTKRCMDVLNAIPQARHED